MLILTLLTMSAFPIASLDLNTNVLAAIPYLIGERRPRNLTVSFDQWALNTVSAVTMSIWDHLLVLSREIDTMWPRPMGFTKVAYILSRYGGDVKLILVAYGTSRRFSSNIWPLIKACQCSLEEPLIVWMKLWHTM